MSFTRFQNSAFAFTSALLAASLFIGAAIPVSPIV